jgi:hypothetical protein
MARGFHDTLLTPIDERLAKKARHKHMQAGCGFVSPGTATQGKRDGVHDWFEWKRYEASPAGSDVGSQPIIS